MQKPPTERPPVASSRGPAALRGLGWPALQATLLVFAVFWIYSPILNGGWLWDDNTEITRNADLRLPWTALGKLWTAPTTPDYFPLKSTFQWVQWNLWQDRATIGYHLTNLLLHLLSSFLLWRLFRKIGLAWAWLGALLFAIHPLAVESVAWIAEFKNAVSLPFALLALTAFVDYDSTRRPSDYIQAILWFLLAMLCKSTVVMLPCAALLFLWWKKRRLVRSDFLAALPFFAISVALGLVTVWFQHHRAIGSSQVSPEGVLPRVPNAGAAAAFYFWKSLWPVDLAPVYPRWLILPPSWWQLLSWPLWGGALVWAWRRRSDWGSAALLGVGFFLLNLAPVLGDIPMSYLEIAWVADHLAYLPLVGLAGLFAAASYVVNEKIQPGVRPVLSIVLGVVCLFLALGARLYAANFESAERLWSYTLQAHPEVWLAQNNFGVLLLSKGQNAEALPYLQRATELNPRYATARVNLGGALARLHRPEEALVQYTEALRLERDSPEAHFNLANLLVSLGRAPEALPHYEQAVQSGPPSVDVLYNFGNTLMQLGRVPEAIARYEEAVRLNRKSFEVQFNLGNVLAASGRFDEAREHFQEAAQILPGSAETHSALGELFDQKGKSAEALREYQEAARLAPTQPEARAALGEAYFRSRRFPEAAREYEEALRLKPGDPELQTALRQARSQVALPFFGP